MLVKDVMNIKVLSIEPQATLLDAAKKMLANEINTLLVMENGELLGAIGLRDLFTAPIPAHYGNFMFRHENEAQLLKIWQTIPVENLMNEKVMSVVEETTLLRAVELMVNSGKHPLPVLRNGKVVGVISRTDVVRGLLVQEEASV
jgi:CBS domain-containing protein